jgi:hypothetical protein
MKLSLGYDTYKVDKKAEPQPCRESAAKAGKSASLSLCAARAAPSLFRRPGKDRAREGGLSAIQTVRAPERATPTPSPMASDAARILEVRPLEGPSGGERRSRHPGTPFPGSLHDCWWEGRCTGTIWQRCSEGLCSLVACMPGDSATAHVWKGIALEAHVRNGGANSRGRPYGANFMRRGKAWKGGREVNQGKNHSLTNFTQPSHSC